MVVGPEVKVPVCVGLLMKHRGGEGVLIPHDQHVQEGQLILLLCLYCELYLLTEAIGVIQEGAQLCSFMGPDDESVVHVPKPIYRRGNESLLEFNVL